MDLTVQKAISLEDGKRQGTIKSVDYRDVEIKGEKVTYADVNIEDKETGIILRYGCSAYISEKSKLGKLLKIFTDITEGQKINPEEILKDREVTFMIMNETTEKGTFANVVDNSIRAAPSEGTNDFTSKDNIGQ